MEVKQNIHLMNDSRGNSVMFSLCVKLHVDYLVMRGHIKGHQSLQENFRCFMVREKSVTVDIISVGKS